MVERQRKNRMVKVSCHPTYGSKLNKAMVMPNKLVNFEIHTDISF